MGSYYEQIDIPDKHIQNIFGQFDKNIKNLEKSMNEFIKIFHEFTS